ncbi:MAG: hypothetical protein OXK79_11855 [Chloroflexota bacterium]|nr:hypothetical protein [Chloroflexota bacterium]
MLTVNGSPVVAFLASNGTDAPVVLQRQRIGWQHQKRPVFYSRYSLRGSAGVSAHLRGATTEIRLTSTK